MAKKQRHDRVSPESTSVTATGHHSAAAAAAAAGTAGQESTAASNPLELLSSQEFFWDSNLTAVGYGLIDNAYCLSAQLPFVDSGLSATEVMHKQKTTEPEKDNAGRQPETVVAPSTSFPDYWFERQFFVDTLTSNEFSSFAPASSTSLGMGRGVVHPTGQAAGTEGSLEKRTQPLVSLASSASLALTNSPQVTERSRGWMDWEPRNTTQRPSTSSTDQMHDPSNKRRRKRPSGATADVVSDFDGSDDDDDDDDDGSVSDIEEDEGAMRTNSQQFAAKFLELRSQGKPCNFWQYNSQSRGPKGRRIYGEITLKDCHVLDEFSDPVMQSGSRKGSSNKLRHGEGNDPRPDSHKLMEIGSRISRLEDEFRRLTAAKGGNKEEVGRQKNKLASRICRLKKKAQHEANKVKLEGLREEHQQLVGVVARLVTMMETHFLTTETTGAMSLVGSQRSLCSQVENLIQSRLKFMIAGHTSDYVNLQLQRAAERLGSTSGTHLVDSPASCAATC